MLALQSTLAPTGTEDDEDDLTEAEFRHLLDERARVMRVRVLSLVRRLTPEEYFARRLAEAVVAGRSEPQSTRGRQLPRGGIVLL